MVEKKILRALIIDDSPDDVEVTLTTLRKAGYTLKMQRVQDAGGVQGALAKGEWTWCCASFPCPTSAPRSRSNLSVAPTATSRSSC